MIEGFVSYEPKMENRFVVKFPEEFGLKPYSIKSATAPKWIEGKGWQPITIELVDACSPSVSMELYGLIKDKSQLLKDSFDFTVGMLGPVGDIWETWEVNCNFVSIEFGKWDWGSDEYLTPIIVVQPNDCKLLKE